MDKKTVPIEDLLKLKHKAEKLEAELAAEREKSLKLETSNRQLEGHLKTAKTNLEDDDEVKEVRSFLEQRDKELAEREEAIKRQETDYSTKTKSVRARELVLDYKSKGLEISPEDLAQAEDMDKFASEKYIEHLEKAKETPKEEKPENVFESTPGSGLVKKSVSDMDVTTPEGKKEFDAYWNRLNQEALSKR